MNECSGCQGDTPNWSMSPWPGELVGLEVEQVRALLEDDVDGDTRAG